MMDLANPPRRSGGRVQFAETVDPDTELTGALAGFRFKVRLRYGDDICVDLSDLDRPDLLRPFVHALWRIFQIGGGAGSLSAASVYVRSVRYFWSYLADRHPDLRRLHDVEPEHLDGFATWMRD